MRKIRLESLILPLVALLVVVADQVTKTMVVENLQLGQSVNLASWLAPIVRLTYITNTGAIFGLLPGFGGAIMVVAAVVILVLLFYNFSLPKGQWLTRLGLGLQLGGSVGNLVDRLMRGGAVVDFLDLNFWPLREWPIFNIADSSIVAGVVVLGITLLLLEEEDLPEEASAENSVL